MMKVRVIECESRHLQKALQAWFSNIENDVKILQLSQVYIHDDIVLTTIIYDERVSSDGKNFKVHEGNFKVQDGNFKVK